MKYLISILVSLTLLITAVSETQAKEAKPSATTIYDCAQTKVKAKSNKKQNPVACLACNIYHEARDQPLQGQILVAKVTIARARSDEYPSSICGVVWDKGQFSWTKRRSVKVHEPEAWEQSLTLARELVTYNPNQNPIMYFHKRASTRPAWTKGFVVAGRIGDHVFYRRK